MKILYKNLLFENLSPYLGGIYKIQIAVILRTLLGYPNFGGQNLDFIDSFPRQENLESKAKFPNPPYRQNPLPEHKERMLAG